MTTTSYYAPQSALPPQTDLLSDRAIVTEAYTVIPRGVLRDIVTSVLPQWENTRAWVLNRPVAGGATTFAQYLMEVAPGGGSDAPEPQPEVEARSGPLRTPELNRQSSSGSGSAMKPSPGIRPRP